MGKMKVKRRGEDNIRKNDVMVDGTNSQSEDITDDESSDFILTNLEVLRVRRNEYK